MLKLQADSGTVVVSTRREVAHIQVQGHFFGSEVGLLPSEARQLAAELLTIAAELDGAAAESETQTVYHAMTVREYDLGGGLRSYRAHCTQCDRYTSAYWDAADCPTRHAEEQ